MCFSSWFVLCPFNPQAQQNVLRVEVNCAFPTMSCLLVLLFLRRSQEPAIRVPAVWESRVEAGNNCPWQGDRHCGLCQQKQEGRHTLEGDVPPCTASPAFLPSLHVPTQMIGPPNWGHRSTHLKHPSTGEAKMKKAHLARCDSIFSNTNPVGQFCKLYFSFGIRDYFL